MAKLRNMDEDKSTRDKYVSELKKSLDDAQGLEDCANATISRPISWALKLADQIVVALSLSVKNFFTFMPFGSIGLKNSPVSSDA